MNKKLIIIFLSVFFCYHVNAQNRYKVVALGFYNCENFFDAEHDPQKMDEDFTPNGAYHYTESLYKKKLLNIATVIQKMATDVTPDGPAIIGLAEIENDKVLNDLIAHPAIKHRNYKYIWFYTPDERGISTAMLYNPKYLKILNAEPLHIPLESINYKRPTRFILHISGVLAGDTVHILVNHWPSRTGGEGASKPRREVAAGVDRRIVDSLLEINPQTKIIIMGDFNDNPDNSSITKVLKAKSDKDKIGLKDIYNPWYDVYKKGIGTEIFQEEWNLIDQIMVSGAFIENKNDKWKFYKNVIFNKEFLKYQTGSNKGQPHRTFTKGNAWDDGYSDHFPVLVYLIEK